MKTLLLIFFVASGLFAQAATHIATLTWTDTQNPAGSTYTAHRATGLCSGTPVFSTLATALTVKTYQDSTITPGNYCYMVTAVLNGAESGASNLVPTSVSPFPVQGLNVQVAALWISDALACREGQTLIDVQVPERTT
jgi:hypothetical protein